MTDIFKSRDKLGHYSNNNLRILYILANSLLRLHQPTLVFCIVSYLCSLFKQSLKICKKHLSMKLSRKYSSIFRNSRFNTAAFAFSQQKESIRKSLYIISVTNCHHQSFASFQGRQARILFYHILFQVDSLKSLYRFFLYNLSSEMMQYQLLAIAYPKNF